MTLPGAIMEIAFMIGALFPTFLVSRLLLWLMRSWDGGISRLLVAHIFSWLVAAFIGGLGMADGGAFAGFRAATLYAVPQGVWFLFDFVRHKRKLRQSVKSPEASG